MHNGKKNMKFIFHKRNQCAQKPRTKRLMNQNEISSGGIFIDLLTTSLLYEKNEN